jgi:hypothetical protein
LAVHFIIVFLVLIGVEIGILGFCILLARKANKEAAQSIAEADQSSPAKMERSDRCLVWASRSFAVLVVTAMWYLIMGVGAIHAELEDRRQGEQLWQLSSLAWMPALFVGGLVGWLVATVCAVIGISRRGPSRQIALITLVTCLVFVATPFILSFLFSWLA